MKIDDTITIAPHAIERFKQRYEALEGVQLSDEESVNRIQTLIAQAKPEEENPVLQLRREAYGGIGEYLMRPPWRIVVSDKRVETCEIVPQDILVVKNPRIPSLSEKTRFFIKVKTDKRRALTQITRYPEKKTLHLRNAIKMNAVVRSLRIIGFEVNHLKEPNRLEIAVPRNAVPYRVEQLAKPESVLISLGRTDLFKLGLQRAHCSGINKIDLERILKFLQVNKPQ